MTKFGEPFHLLAEARGVIAVGGEDRVAFLQGLVSNDVRRVADERAIWAALLTPQGRYLHDFFIATVGDRLLLDCEAARRDDLRRRLTLYKLRAKVTIADATADYAVALLFGEGALAALGLPAEPGRARPWAGGAVFVDPRLAALGARAILPRDGASAALTEAKFAAGTNEAYEHRRLSLGVPDGSRDLAVEKALLLENGFDELNGIDWQKGCYIGQELTARTKYRGLVKKRLMPVAIDGPPPPPGTPVMRGAVEVGELRGAVDGLGLALLRIEDLESGPFTAGEARAIVRVLNRSKP